MNRLLVLLAAAMPVVVASNAASAQTPPLPFPGAAAPPATAKPSTPAAPTPSPAPPAASQAPGVPSASTLGAPVYPGATPLEVIDAGQGQRIYLFGTNAPYLEIVNYYKNVLKISGRELFKAPAMQQFDIGRFQEDTMTYQPSVVVKDYTWNNQDGYLFIDGTKEQRFKTIIQIVPPTIK
ncbi:MAG TPA: hypothetical protein VLT86_02625 [Vicinamibacterales bacterium]|nr:hypothetical protein [Vicinamibacterales bacterium]